MTEQDGILMMHEAIDRALLAKTEQAAANGTYELFKMSAFFDGTAKHPEWLGEDTDAAKRLAPAGYG